MLKWYAINTYSGREDSVKAELLRRIALSSYPTAFKEVNVPKYTETKKLKDGKTKVVEKVTMPGYLLVHMDIENKLAESLVRNTQGVIGFVGTGGNASPLSKKDVDNIMGKSIITKNPSNMELYEVGTMVEFIDGPFVSMEGLIEDVMEGKLKVGIEGMFGRPVVVEVEVSQVRKKKTT